MMSIRKLKFGLLLSGLGLALCAAAPAQAQVAQQYWQCKTTNPVGWCPTSSVNPAPVTLGGAGATGNNVGGYDNDVAVTPTVTAGAYSSGQSLGGLMTFPIWRSTVQPSGVLSHLFVASKGGATSLLVAYVFDTLPSASTCTDTSAFVLGAADVPKLALAPFSVTPALLAGTTTTFGEVAIPRSSKNSDAPATVNVYVCLVAGAAITPASTTDLVVHVGGVQD